MEPKTQELPNQGLFQLQDNGALSDYPDFIRKPQSATDDELDSLFQQAGYQGKKETIKEESVKKVSEALTKTETPTQMATKEIGGAMEPAKVVGGALAGFGNIVLNGAQTAVDFISNFGQQSPDFKPWGEVIPTPDPDTQAGKMIKQVGIYVAPLAVSSVTGTAPAMLAGAAIDFAGIDPNQDRLSNLVQEVPWLRNPMAAAMMRTPGESQFKARLMNSLEGLLTMGMATGLVKGIKGTANIFAKKTAKTLVDAVEADKAVKQVLMGTTDGKVHISEVDLAKSEAQLGSNVENVPAVSQGQQVLPGFEEEYKRAGAMPAFTIDQTKMQGATTVAEMSKAVGINLEKLNTTDDVLKVVTEFATQNKDAINKYRKTMSFGEIQDAANVLLQSEDRVQELIKSGLSQKDASETLAAQIVAHKMLTSATAEEMVRMANKAIETGSPEDLVRFMDSKDKFSLVFTSMRGKQTEVAVAQSAGKIVVENGVSAADRAKFFDEAIRLSGGSEHAINQAKQIKLISEMPDSQFAVRGGEIVKATKSMRFANALSFYTLNNILTLKSALSATVGNALNIIHKDISLFAGAGIGTARKIAFGAENTLTFTDATREVYGQMAALGEAFVNAKNSLIRGKSVTPGGNIVRIDMPFVPANPLTTEALFGIDSSKSMLAKLWNMGAQVEGLPTRMITPADSFFGTISYRGRQHANALRNADRAGLEGEARKLFLQDYMKNVIDQDAIHHAENITLSGANALSTFVNEQLPLAKVVFPVMKTNVNEMMFIFENSPFMLASSKARNATGAEADMIYGGVATAMAGTGVMAYMAHMGMITGEVPKNPMLERKLRETNKGWQPNSVKIGDHYISMDKFGLLSAQMRIGAFLNDARNFVNDQEYQELFTAAASAIWDAHTPESYIANVGEFFKSMADAAEPGDVSQSKIEKVALDFTKRMVPLGAVQNQIARVVDPVVPSTVTQTTGMGPMEAFLAKAKTILKGRTPWLSKDVPPQVNLFGEVVMAPSGWSEMTDGIPGLAPAGQVADLIFPFAVSPYDNTPLVKELKDLAGFATELGKIDPDMPTMDFKMPSHVIRNVVDGEPFQLSPVEYYNYMIRSSGVDPKTGNTVSPNGLTLRQTIEQIVDTMGKKQISEIYAQENGALAAKKIIGKIQSAVNAYRQQGLEYLKNDTDVYDRMKLEFEKRNKAKTLEGQ